MTAQLQLFPRPEGPHCPSCRLRGACGAEQSDDACSLHLEFGGPGGPHALHPLHPDFDLLFDAVGGHQLEDLELRPAQSIPELPPHLPQVRWLDVHRSDRIDVSAFPFLGIRLKEVYRPGRVRSAADVFAKTGISPAVGLVLLLHGKDELLERFSVDDQAVASVGEAGYALVTPPSYSIWEPGRRPNHVLALRRSLLDCVRLQLVGATVCPRVAWANERDVERVAEWVVAAGAELVSIDLMTYGEKSFDRTAGLLARFDELTGARCRYLIDGVRAKRRIETLYLAGSPERVTVSDATMARPAPKAAPASLDRRSLRARAAMVERACRDARCAVERAQSSPIEKHLSGLLATNGATYAGAA